MNWLNINTTSLRSPEFISSEPVERATWLCVLSYSAEQENGGRVLGAALWSDRQWQQTCGVTLAEVRQTTKLLLIEGDDVLVAFYPRDQEKKQQNNRRKASAGGVKSAAIRALKRQSAGQPASPASSLASTPASTERNGKEKEGNSAHAQAMPSAGGDTPGHDLQEIAGEAALSGNTGPVSEAISSGAQPPAAHSEATASGTGSSHHAAVSQPRAGDAKCAGENPGGQEQLIMPRQLQNHRAGIFPGLASGDPEMEEQESTNAACVEDGLSLPAGLEAKSGQLPLESPCTLAEALQYAKTKGHPERITTYWLKRRDAAGWRFPNGGPIHNWNSDLDGWVMEEMRRHPDEYKAPKAPAASAQLRSSIDPASWARWASTFASAPSLATASDRLVERFRRETEGGEKLSTLNI